MNIILLGAYDGFNVGQTIHASLYEGSLLLARGLGRQVTTADFCNPAIAPKQGTNRRSNNRVVLA